MLFCPCSLNSNEYVYISVIEWKICIHIRRHIVYSTSYSPSWLSLFCVYFLLLLLFVSAGVLLLTSYTRTHIICGYNFARASARTHLTLTYSYVGVIINSTTASTTHMCVVFFFLLLDVVVVVVVRPAYSSRVLFCALAPLIP